MLFRTYAPATITVDIDPVSARLGHLSLGWYGLALGVAALVGLAVLRHEARRRELPVESVLTVTLWTMAGGLAGARALFVIDHLSSFADSPSRAFALQEGGLAIQGALLGGLAAGVIAARLSRLPIMTLADAAAPAIVLAQAIGRLGCLVTGDALGAATSAPWGVRYVNPGAMAPQFGTAYQPVFADEALWDLGIFLMLWSLRGRVRRPGLLFGIYLGTYAAGKFALTFFRQEQAWLWGLQEAHLLAIALLVVSAGFILKARLPTQVPALQQRLEGE